MKAATFILACVIAVAIATIFGTGCDDGGSGGSGEEKPTFCEQYPDAWDCDKD
jgi:hypothetical protein